jgi:hypothetical protein
VAPDDAVKAMVLNGLGLVHQPLYRWSRFFQDKPTARFLAPLLIEAKLLHEDALGRGLDTLDADGVTELYRLIAATAAARLGLAAPFVHLDRTSVPVDGRPARRHHATAPDQVPGHKAWHTSAAAVVP